MIACEAVSSVQISVVSFKFYEKSNDFCCTVRVGQCNTERQHPNPGVFRGFVYTDRMIWGCNRADERCFTRFRNDDRVCFVATATLEYGVTILGNSRVFVAYPYGEIMGELRYRCSAECVAAQGTFECRHALCMASGWGRDRAAVFDMGEFRYRCNAEFFAAQGTLKRPNAALFASSGGRDSAAVFDMGELRNRRGTECIAT